MMQHSRSRPWPRLAAALMALAVLGAGEVVAWATPPPTVSASVGSLNPADPLYSGTQAWVSATCEAGGAGVRLTEIDIYVGNTRIYCNTGPLPPYPYNVQVSPAFSTTGWPDGSQPVVSVRVWQSDGQYTPANSCDSTMWNKAYCMYNTDLTYGRQLANYAALQPVGHESLGCQCRLLGHRVNHHRDQPELGREMLNTCVLYEDSRGNSGFFVDGPNQTYVMAQDAITPAVEAKVDAAVPQAFNFVFCDPCDSAKDCSLAIAFKAYAFLGWTTVCYDSQDYATFREAVWQALGIPI